MNVTSKSPDSPKTAQSTAHFPLADQWGRVADDLRISLIDKCNLRCTYCMPEEGMQWLPKKSLLSTAEAIRIANIGVRLLGVKDIRFTGGEPLIRRDLEEIVAGVRALHPEVSISLTTNAIGLDKRVAGLAKAGLTRINVSLDTVRKQTFAEMTRRDRLDAVIRGIDAALTAGLDPVKVNAVMLRGINDGQAAELLDWCLQRGLQLRFIEQMPLDADHNWARENLVSAAEIREQISEQFRIAVHPAPRGSAPAQLWDVFAKDEPVEDATPLGQVGIIASVTESFCAACSRTRITADGHIRSCLFSHEETDLMELLRDGSSDEDIARRWQSAMWMKPRAYGSDDVTLNSADYVQPERTMSAIGG
ncbi:GTP 3',8-cyclase MoaA [Corynebacterium dentalis]|uniref:GTP 3',8-cyclase MoaA n=1 Tax=Corynebacterium dentalis TaxID=2014528 RepID=UPI0028974E13|nr:GTP 3',8-cyclase MoaA [Corynebacterium dentalis]